MINDHDKKIKILNVVIATIGVIGATTGDDQYFKAQRKYKRKLNAIKKNGETGEYISLLNGITTFLQSVAIEKRIAKPMPQFDKGGIIPVGGDKPFSVNRRGTFEAKTGEYV